MGIFGRDDRTSPTKAAGQPQKDRPQAAPPAPAEQVTVVGRGNRIEGTISGSGDVQIDGELQGKVDATGGVRVTPQGRVDGSIRARAVVVAGAVRGDVVATESVQLDSSARVEGNLTAPRIRIAEGATFDGQVFMKDVTGKHATTTPAHKPD